MGNWFALMGDYLGGWPANYVVFDVETQGLDVTSSTTLICQLGWCVVEGRKVVHDGELVIDWTIPELGLNLEWLAGTLEKTRHALVSKGRAYHCSLDQMRADGVHPGEAFAAYRDLLAGRIAAGFPLVGHNAWAFDRPLLANHLRQWATPLVVTAEQVIDTGLIEKCRGMKEPPPEPETPRKSWYTEISQARRSVRWNLTEHCTQAYELQVELARAHDAGYDCRLNALLLEKMRHLSGA